MSGRGLQLREKQKVRRTYGMLERQFRGFFTKAARQPGKTADTLFQMLEMRLDNVVYRLGFADSRAQARQLVTHGHFQVNGRKTDIPSYLCKAGDEIVVRERSRNLQYFKDRTLVLNQRGVPAWLSTRVRSLKYWRVRLRSRTTILRSEEHTSELHSPDPLVCRLLLVKNK